MRKSIRISSAGDETSTGCPELCSLVTEVQPFKTVLPLRKNLHG